APIDLVGKEYDRLIVRELTSERDKHGRRLWLCDCKCGGTAKVATSFLRNGNTRSCGCLKRDHPGRQGMGEIARRAYAKKKTTRVKGRLYYSPQRAVAYTGKSYFTLVRYANRNKTGKKRGCPWLQGKPIGSIVHEGALGRKIIYFLKSDLKRMLNAMR